MHRLKITNCKNHIDQITLTEGNHTIGRTLDCTLRLEGEEVSRLHARLLIHKNSCELIDEKSKNGTFINGKRISSHNLYDSDTIQIGNFKLQFLSDTAKPHTLLHPDKKVLKKPVFSIILSLSMIVILGFSFYQNASSKNTVLQLAERTAQYLAEKNKEALYLGEYDSINLTDLPKQVVQIAVWDRNNTLRAQKPQSIEPLAMPKTIDSIYVHSAGRNIEVYIPVYCEDVRVGTLGIKYKT